MKSSFVYILKCSDGTFYTGVTNNVERRFAEHVDNENPKSYTFSRKPLELVFSTEFLNIEDAIAFEKRLKKWSQAKKIALIENRYDDLPNLSKKKFKT